MNLDFGKNGQKPFKIMKTYLFTVGKCVDSPKITNTTEVVIEYMHGDADHYTTKSFKFPMNESSDYDFTENDIVFIIENWLCLNWNLRCDMLSNFYNIGKWISTLGYENTDIFYDIFEMDITSDDARAHINSCNIYWYNNNGLKFIMDVHDSHNNQKINLRNEY